MTENAEDRPLEQEPVITVDMIADLACPWCYLGLVRIDKARAMRPGLPVTLRWWPYLLNPQLPRDGMDRQTYLRSKFGGDAQARDVYARIKAAGDEEGIPFAFDKMPRTPNTVSAQRLVLLAQSQGKGEAMIRVLFKALFEDGVDIGHGKALFDLAETAGLPRAEIEALFAGETFSADIVRAHQRAQMMGVQGIPVYMVDREHVIAGAQSAEVLAGLLDVASARAVA